MKTLEQELSRIDLNLLVSLSVLIKEKNVSRAADKLYLSQPAMSRILGRLRNLFDDPLFYRESNGLQPTAKTLELEAKLDTILLSVDSLINSSSFNPELCEKNFRLSVPPLMSQLLMTPLAKRVGDLAPNATLEEYPSSFDPILLLKEGQVDFSIHVEDAPVSDEYHSTKIGSTYPVIYGVTDHPLLSKPSITLDDCLQYPFVDLSLDIRSNNHYLNPIDVALAKQGKSRTIALKSGQLSTLTQSIEGTERLIIAGHALAQSEVLDSRFQVIKPFEEAPHVVDIYLIEHRRTLSSPSHNWLKSMILESLKGKISV